MPHSVIHGRVIIKTVPFLLSVNIINSSAEHPKMVTYLEKKIKMFE